MRRLLFVVVPLAVLLAGCGEAPSEQAEAAIKEDWEEKTSGWGLPVDRVECPAETDDAGTGDTVECTVFGTDEVPFSVTTEVRFEEDDKYVWNFEGNEGLFYFFATRGALFEGEPTVPEGGWTEEEIAMIETGDPALQARALKSSGLAD